MNPRLYFLMVGLLVACGGPASESTGTEPVVRDSAGVSIIDNGVIAMEVEAITPLDPTTEIGVVEGPEEYQLFRVSDAKRLTDGGIAVANGGTRELRIYNSDGTHRATAGGPGDGPHEFRYPVALVVLAGDTIQVDDFMDRVVFSSSGTFLRRRTADRQAFNELWQNEGGFSEGGQWMADGTFFAVVYARDRPRHGPGRLFRPSMTFVRLSGDLVSVDTLGSYGGLEQQYVEVGGTRGTMPIVPPFSSSTVWAAGSADGTLVAADNAAPQVERFHPDGTRSIVRWSAEPEPVRPAEVEEWKDQQRTADWTRGQLEALERGWAAMDVRDFRPFYGRATAGSDGALWVSPVESTDGQTIMMRFDPAGFFAGTFRFRGRFVVHDSGHDWVLGVMRDGNDVERIQLFDLPPVDP